MISAAAAETERPEAPAHDRDPQQADERLGEDRDDQEEARDRQDQSRDRPVESAEAHEVGAEEANGTDLGRAQGEWLVGGPSASSVASGCIR